MPFTPYIPQSSTPNTSSGGFPSSNFTPYNPTTYVNPHQGIQDFNKTGFPTQAPPQVHQNLLQKLGSGVVNYGKSVGNNIKNNFQDTIATAKNAPNLDSFGQFSAGMHGAGNLFGAILSPLTEAVSGVVNKTASHVANDNQFQKFANSGAGDAVVSAQSGLTHWATLHPQAAKDLGDLNNALQLGTLLAGGPKVAENTGALASDVGSKAVDLGTKLGTKAVDTAKQGAVAAKEAISPTLTPEEAVGQVIQGKTEDIPAAHRTLKNIDTSGIKTYKDLQSKVNSSISTLSKAQDTLLSGDKRVFKIQQLATKVGDTPAAHNYVNDALGQLKDYFTKTNDVANLQKVNALIAKANPTKGAGLTLQEVNNIAKMHGINLNAYNANNELASGLSKVAAENTRIGLKNTIRNLLPNDASKTIDSHISDAYDTKALIDKQVEKVNTAAQKTPKQGIVPKVVSKVIKAGDFVAGSPLKAIGKEIGTTGSSGTLSPTEIEGRLLKNLKIIQQKAQQ